MAQFPDITDDIGPLEGDARIPMFSYARPAYELWQAVYEGMRESGHTHAQAVHWLLSKGPRHALDGLLGEELRTLGLAYGRSV